MSYLSQTLRLHFVGKFQATVSTVNNDVTHFNNATFDPSFQTRPGGWWNPKGDGVWRLLGCKITSAVMDDGSPVPTSDPVLSGSVADSDDSAPAKIVDLDPQQQMVSTIYGLKVRIADGNGNTLMKGDYAPAAFTELWNKVWSTAGGDAAFGAMWQSIITVTAWGDVSASPFLSALKKSADANSGLLSIKFNVDLYSMNWPEAGKPGGDQFCRGRIVGTIGPASASEPRHFVLGRQLVPQMINGAVVNFCAAVVDAARKTVRIDLGNALPVKGDGSMFPLGDLLLKVPNPANGRAMLVGRLLQSDYTDPTWYPRTAGIVEFPLSPATAGLVGANPLMLAIGGSSASPVMAQEMPDGLHVRADSFVFRLSEGQGATATFFATKFGQPLANEPIVFFNNPSGLQGPVATPDIQPGALTGDDSPFGPGSPYVNAPSDGVTYPAQVVTDDQGRAQISITGGNTQNFRAYIDGQLYGIGYGLAEQGYASGTGPAQSLSNLDGWLANPWNFISVLVFDRFTPDVPPTWWGSLEPIFRQYANLYPVMARFVDLGDYAQVVQYAGMLKFAFSLPDEDPNAMPVTRDLSPAKRQAIRVWLENPLLGSPPSGPKPAAKTAPTLNVADAATGLALEGGKAAAMARRWGHRKV